MGCVQSQPNRKPEEAPVSIFSTENAAPNVASLRDVKMLQKYKETQLGFGENERKRVLNVAVHTRGDDADRTRHLSARSASFAGGLL